MKNWFFISVVIILLGFSAIYLVVKSSAPVTEDLGLAPNILPLCENQKSVFTLCTNGVWDSRDYGKLNYVSGICEKITGVGDSQVRIYSLPTASGCPKDFTLRGKLVVSPPAKDDLCTVTNSVALNGQQPPSCADGCKDGGVKLKTGKEYPMGYNADESRRYCCDVNLERTCSNPPESGSSENLVQDNLIEK